MISVSPSLHLLDGRSPNREDIGLLLENSAYLWGSSVFTTALIHKGNLAFHDYHLKRLIESAKWLWSKDDLEEWITNSWNESLLHLREHHLKEEFYKLRFTLFKDPQNEIHSHLCLSPFSKGTMGVELELTPVPIFFRRREEELTFDPKVGSYLETFRSWSQAQAMPLFYDKEGLVLETPISNIFFYNKKSKEDVFIYPYVKGQMLLGIGLEQGLKGLSLRQESLNIEQLDKFTHAFVINSLRGPQPVLSLGKSFLWKEDDISKTLFQRVLKQFNQNIEKSQRKLWPMEKC